MWWNEKNYSSTVLSWGILEMKMKSNKNKTKNPVFWRNKHKPLGSGTSFREWISMNRRMQVLLWNVSTSWKQEQCRVAADFLFSIFRAHVISFLYLFKCIQYVQIGPKFNISQCPPWYFPCLSHHHLLFTFYNSFLMGLISLHPPLLPSMYLKHKRESTPHRVSQILLLSSQNLS